LTTIPKIEGLVDPADNHNVAKQYDPQIHGTEGPLKIALYGLASPLDPLVIEATKQTNILPMIEDMNGGSPVGMGMRIPYGHRFV
jgi:hypothetical protein